MAFVLNSKITIGEYFFTGGVSELVIKKSVLAFCDNAVLKIPSLGRIISISQSVNRGLNLFGYGAPIDPKQLPKSSIQTARLFKEGDPVSIDLGYNGDLRNEFRGFIRRVSLTTPIVIDMEGYAWQLRNKNILASWKNTTVREVLERIIQGTDIVLSPDIPEIKLTSYTIGNKTGIDVLDDLQRRMLLTVYFKDNVLYAGLQETRTTAPGTLGGLAEVKYNIGYNCITNQPNLKQRLGKDNLVRVVFKTRLKNGKSTFCEAGDKTGALYEQTIPFCSDDNYLQKAADAKLKSLKYDGYEGHLIGFLQPYCMPGWKATLIDKRFAGARAGTYFITGTEVTFGVKGGRRKVYITHRLDAENTQLIN